MKTVYIAIGSFGIGLATAAIALMPSTRIDQHTVDRCRAEVAGLQEMPEGIREKFNEQLEAHPNEAKRWRIVKAIADIDV